MKTHIHNFLGEIPGDRTVLSTFSREYTLSEIKNEAEQYEIFLGDKSDVSGKKVALLVPHVFPFISLVMAINKLGGTIIPLSMQYRGNDLLEVLEYLEPDIVFSINHYNGFSFIDMVEQWAASRGEWTAIYKSDETCTWEKHIFHPDNKRKADSDNQPDMIFCTSGSTGTPKGLAVNVGIFSFPLIVELMDLDATDHLLVNPPFSSIIGFATLVSALQFGYKVVYPESFDILRMIQLMQDASCNKLLSTPSIFKAIYSFAVQKNPQAVNRLQLCGLAGEMISDDLIESFSLMKDTRFLGIYGCSEVGGVLQRDLRENKGWVICKGVEVSIDNDHDIGELMVWSPFMFDYYYGHPEITSEVLTKDKWFLTGDMARFIDGRLIELIGRKKDLIKKGGQQVSPAELEHLLSRHPNVRQAAVFGLPHPVFGEQIVALVVPEGGIAGNELYHYCMEKIARFKVPDIIELIDEIPMISGKVDKITLRNQFIKKSEVIIYEN